MKRLLALVVPLALTACAMTAKLTTGGEGVRVIKETPQGCRFVAEIEANDAMWASRSNGRVYFRNRAAEVGGNVAVLDTVGNHLHQGRAYLCPQAVFDTL